MADNRFPSVGVDARFPSPGVDVRFPAPGQDLEHLPDGTDTRFQGATYGGAAGLPPVISVAPAVTGDAVRGSTLSCTTGTWAQSPGGGALSYAYQWTRDGANIGGATSSTYATTGSDVGTAVGCKVTATDVYGASSPATATGAVTVLSFSGAVAAMLAGTPGFAIRHDTPARLWTTSAKSANVVNAADPVGAFESMYGNTVYDWLQTTAGSRPAWDGVAGLSFDGSDDRMDDTANPCFNGASAGVMACSFRTSGTLASRQVAYFSFGPNGNTIRAGIEYYATGAINVNVRRNDAGVGANYTSAGGVILASTRSDVVVSMDLTGANRLYVWVNGTQVIDTPLTDGTGAFSATNSAVVRFANSQHNNKIGSFVAAPILITNDQRLLLEAWLAETAL